MEEQLPKPHNGACDRCAVCHWVREKCRQGLNPQDFGQNSYVDKWWEKTDLRSAPSRRWIDCAGWKMTLGMVFDKESGSWIYPPVKIIPIVS